MEQDAFRKEQLKYIDEIDEMLKDVEGVSSSLDGESTIQGVVMQAPQYEEGQEPEPVAEVTEKQLDKVRGIDWKVFRQMKKDDGFKEKVMKELETAKNLIRSDMIRKYGADEMKNFDEVMADYPLDAQVKFYKFANKRGGIRRDDLLFHLLTFTDFLAVLLRELPEGMYEAVNHLVNVVDAACTFYETKTQEAMNKQCEMLDAKIAVLNELHNKLEKLISSSVGGATGGLSDEQMNLMMKNNAMVVGAYLNDNPDLHRNKLSGTKEKSTFLSLGVLLGGAGLALSGLALVLSQLAHLF